MRVRGLLHAEQRVPACPTAAAFDDRDPTRTASRGRIHCPRRPASRGTLRFPHRQVADAGAERRAFPVEPLQPQAQRLARRRSAPPTRTSRCSILHRLGLGHPLEEQPWADPARILTSPSRALALNGKRGIKRIPRIKPRRNRRVDVPEHGLPKLRNRSWIRAVESHLHLLHVCHRPRVGPSTLRPSRPGTMSRWTHSTQDGAVTRPATRLTPGSTTFPSRE